MKFRQSFVVDGRALQPAEWRLFEPPDGGNQLRALLASCGGRIYDYGDRFNSVPDPFVVQRCCAAGLSW